MRRTLMIGAFVAALSFHGVPVLASDGPETCPHPATGSEFGAHVSDMARAGHLGADMNPGVHRGYSPMAH